MDCKKFQTAKLDELAALTGVDRTRWSRYLSGKVALNEKTLSGIAAKLGMTPEQFLTAFRQRREKRLLNRHKNR